MNLIRVMWVPGGSSWVVGYPPILLWGPRHIWIQTTAAQHSIKKVTIIDFVFVPARYSQATLQVSTLRHAMTATQRCGFLVLPTELRLEIYRYTIVNCLDRGSVSDISGLFRCCREVRQELEAEFMGTLRPLLTAKYRWERSAIEDSAFVRITLFTNLHIATEDIALQITLPIYPGPRDNHGIFSANTLTGTAKFLRPILKLRWPTVTVRLVDTNMHSFSMFSAQRLFKQMFGLLGKNTLRTLQVDRLILNFGNEGALVSDSQFWALFAVYTFARRQSTQRSGSRKIKRGWMSRIPGGCRSGWRLTLDFQLDLGPIKEALWVLEDDENQTLLIRRLFDSLEMVTADNPFETFYMASVAREDNEALEFENGEM
jgi:hypothetical protein